jgi:hypothetical protein
MSKLKIKVSDEQLAVLEVLAEKHECSSEDLVQAMVKHLHTAFMRGGSHERQAFDSMTGWFY